MFMRILGIIVVIVCAVLGWQFLGGWLNGLISSPWGNIVGLVIGLVVSGPICGLLFKRG